MTLTIRIDIDGTIGEPKFYEHDFWATARLYIETGLVTEEEVKALHSENHQRLWLLPQILLTHTSMRGAVQALQNIAQKGLYFEYFTVRQAIDPGVCEKVHENTCLWLEQQSFPYPRDVRFFWDAGDKLVKSLDAPEDYIALIDDRVSGLLQAYQRIVEQNLALAEEIRKRVILVAFGSDGIENLPHVENAPEIYTLADWFHFSELLSLLGEKFIDTLSIGSEMVQEE